MTRAGGSESRRTFRRVEVDSTTGFGRVRPEIPPPYSSVHANRPSSPVLCTPDAEIQVEFEAGGILAQGPSEASIHRLRAGAGDDKLSRSQRLDQVVDQGWVAYFDFHLPQLLPRVAARTALTSHSRQKRSPVKGAVESESTSGVSRGTRPAFARAISVSGTFRGYLRMAEISPVCCLMRGFRHKK